jgi:hypothetical protein
MTDAARTPEEALQGLPDYPFQAHYREVHGLRLAHLDEGEGPPVIFMHGEPTWSFLWRKVIPPVLTARLAQTVARIRITRARTPSTHRLRLSGACLLRDPRLLLAAV